MEAENKIARLKAKLRFTLVFAIALIVTTTGGIVTIVTAQKGISLLESKKAEYDNVFKKQAELNFQIEELFRDLNNLKTKRRNSSEHKHMQKLITKKRLLMENDIAMQADKSKYEVYKAMLEQIRVIQSSMDDLDRESKKRESNMEQLEKCRIKYQEFTKYLYADVANVSFGGLIPNDKYYLLIFACNPDGSPKLDDKINLKKVEVNTSPAAMSSVQYELSVSSIAKIDAMVTVRADGNYENETFLFNYITKAEYDAISGDKTAGLKAHMDAFIDARVKDWNDSHPNSGVMTRKEFLSRALMNGKEDLFVPIEIGGLTPGTTYYLYVFGLKADGTYTTEPVTTQFTTVADQVTLASLEFIVMSYGYPEENRNMYRVWTYANNSKEHYFQSFVGEDEWAGKTASEVRELLKASRWPSSSSYKVDAQFGQTWYGYSVAYDEAGIPTKVYKLWHTSPADTGDGFDNITGGTITVDIEELSE